MSTKPLKEAEEQTKEAIIYSERKMKKSGRSELALMVVAGLMTVATIVLAILLGVGVGDEECPPPVVDTTCETKECVTAASRILGAMDTSVDPCNDFYAYSCGMWDDSHLIPEGKSAVSTFNDVLERDWTNDRESIQKSKKIYASCMDTAGIDAKGGQPALDLIDELNGMPLFGDDFDANNFAVEETFAKASSQYGSFAVLSMWVGTDDKNSSANIIQMDQPSLGMPNREYYLDEEKRNKTLPGYQEYMRGYLSMLWQEKETNNVVDSPALEETIQSITNLETDIAGIMAADEDRRDSFAIYNKVTINTLQTDINPDFDFLAYINQAFSVVGKTLTIDDEVVIYAKEYFMNFTKVLDKYDPEVLQNYMIWMVLRGRVSYLGKDYRDTQAPYRMAVAGTTAEEPRWETCSDMANDNFPMPVGSLFVQEAFPEENKAVTELMVENIRTAFKKSLPQNEWMDQETKDKADSKADAIQPIIAYPDYIIDENDPKMDNDYNGAIVSETEYFDNMQSMVEFSTTKNFNKLGTAVDREAWITGPAVVNAFYSPTRNQIVFPAGILQPPFYDAGQPNSMNYGGIGMVIGHEITHGFDDSGAQFDEIGNLNNWWSAQSKANFDEKAECMVNQYDNYYWETAGMNINGKLTLGENIADNGGIREALDAYRVWVDAANIDFKLPGLQNYTQEQLFFLSFAQIWCGSYRKEYAERLILTDPHSPGIYRVIGSISNYAEFGKAFQCKQGSDEMYPNPEDTCRVW